MIIRRITTVRCDKCEKITAELEHDLDFECDRGYSFNQAIDNAGWGDVWLNDRQGYGHLCPQCFKERRKLNDAKEPPPYEE